MFRGVKERGDDAAKPLTLLHEVEIFRPLSEVAKLYLSQRMRRKTYAAGDTIVHQGDEGNSLFIVVEGVVSVRVNVKGSAAISETTEVARLGSGNFFGEMALLTGADRTATVVSMTETVLFEITKADIAPVMAKQPAISELFSKVLTQRRLRTSSKLSLVQQLKDAAQRKEEEDTLRERIRNQIQHFFGLKK
jgi:branched-chain amino acid transport system substrate-binding protein